MKRDMDLVRLILITIENAEGPVDARTLACDAYSFSDISFHAELLRAHGLIEADVQKAWGGVPSSCRLSALTWEGYDYLDAIRSEKVWAKAKSAIADSVGDTSLSVIKETCSALALATIKASLGI